MEQGSAMGPVRLRRSGLFGHGWASQSKALKRPWIRDCRGIPPASILSSVASVQAVVPCFGHLMHEEGARVLVHLLNHVPIPVGDAKGLLADGRVDALYQALVSRHIRSTIRFAPLVSMALRMESIGDVVNSGMSQQSC